jgi:predicted DNA repair protein MutK
MQAGALVAVAIGITIAVYGVVAIIVKLDDIGLKLVAHRWGAMQRFGNLLVQGVPHILAALAVIGTAAMLWVGGGIILHGLEELHLITWLPHAVHDGAHAVAEPFGAVAPVVEWLANAIGASIVGAIVGGIIVAFLHYSPWKKAEHGVEQIP